MNYYQWPDTLKSGIPSYYYKLNGERIDIDSIPPGTAYDWDNMLNSYSESYTDTQAIAVATLMYHVGVANNMLYAWSKSSASAPFEEFYAYFGYDEDLLQRLYASSYNLADWNSILQQELQLKRPIYYRGDSDDAGHAFVCDGVDSDGLYHINWGWGGYQDGYYDITILNPEKGGTGSGTSTNGYTQSCMAIVGIYPDNNEDDSYTYVEPSLDVYEIVDVTLDSVGRTSTTQTLSVSIDYKLANKTTSYFNGLLSLAILENDGSITPIGTTVSLKLKARLSATTYYVTTCSLSADYAFAVGTYTLIPVYSTDEGSTWNVCGGSDNYATIVEVTENSISQVPKILSAELTVDSGTMYQYVDNSLTLTLTNSYNVDYTGTIYMYGSETDTIPSNYVSNPYVRVAAGGSQTIELNITIEDESVYYFWIVDDNDNLLIDGQEFDVSDETIAVTVTAEDGLYCNISNVLQIDVYNPLPVSYSGYLYFYGSTDSIQPDSYKKYKSISLASDESLSYTVTVNPGDSLTYYVWIKDTNNRLLIDCQEFDVAQNMSIDNDIMDDVFWYVIGKGTITIYSQINKPVRIYNLNGQLIFKDQISIGETRTIFLSPGIYILDGRKIVIR